ncbi:MAG TPA: iron-sulfur cluster assembly protein, partial [Dehalococcoidia bacterium]|nr:iron-sulfur cluster assembly protein [Dehalococcoidia bacterium]
CSVLAIEGLRSAIQNYEEKHGLVKERKPTTVDVVKRRLKKVISPVTGVSVVRSNMVQDIQVNEGNVRVVIDLPSSHQFASAMKQEVIEKIEPLWDVKEVKVEFTE